MLVLRLLLQLVPVVGVYLLFAVCLLRRRFPYLGGFGFTLLVVSGWLWVAIWVGACDLGLRLFWMRFTFFGLGLIMVAAVHFVVYVGFRDLVLVAVGWFAGDAVWVGLAGIGLVVRFWACGFVAPYRFGGLNWFRLFLGGFLGVVDLPGLWVFLWVDSIQLSGYT